MTIYTLYIREYPDEVGLLISRTLEGTHYTLTGVWREQLTWELCVSNPEPRRILLLETILSEYVIAPSETVDDELWIQSRFNRLW